MKRALDIAVLGVVLALAAPAGATDAGPALAAAQARAEEWLRTGWDDPEAALAQIGRALAEPGLAAPVTRTLQRARGAVAARGGRQAEAAASLAWLDRQAQVGDAMAHADAELVRALQDERIGRSAQAVVHAREAAGAYGALCAAKATREDCDPRAHWLALQTLLLRERSDLEPGVAMARADEAIARAREAGDLAQQAWTLAVQASLAATRGDRERAGDGIARALGLLRGAGRPDVEARVWMEQLRIATQAADEVAIDRALAAAVAASHRAKSPRLLAICRLNESDLMVRRHRPARALAAVEAALPVMRRFDDLRLEHVLMHNGALALIALGRLGEARAQADRLLDQWSADGTPGENLLALREVADALAAAGDVRSALDLYHREREIGARLMQTQREKAEQALRARYDRDREQREIELRARDNAIQATELDNRVLSQRLWQLASAALLLGAVLVGLLLRRVRATQRALQHSQAQLKLQSERDALTGTANRRHGQARLEAESHAATGAWSGAMLLIDVDHFKRINDGMGHAVGDQVLVEVARRLQSTVRAGDVVMRWGGEEFLVLVASDRGAALDGMASRLMGAVGAEPVQLSDGQRLAVTVSIGYGAFPLPPRGEGIGWERALNVVDLALYAAKNRGRNRAVGIRALADDEHALDDAERDFEQASRTGRVQLVVDTGP